MVWQGSLPQPWSPKLAFLAFLYIMSLMFSITAKARTAGTKGALETGYMPAVFYGAGKETTSIAVSLKEFEKVWKNAGESSTVTLETPSGKVETLIHEVQVDPVKGFPIHADFLVIDMNKEIEVGVPLEFTGEAPAVKQGLGSLTKVLHELEIKALPKDLPHSITVDISSLATLEDKIHVSDIVLPKGVVAVTPAEEVVALVQAAKEEKEETGPVDLSAIEVSVEKGKKEDAEAPADETK